jgi:hypothetical protein
MKRSEVYTVSRRGLLTAAAAAPLLGAASVRPELGTKIAAPTVCVEDPVVELAHQCVARHRENERLLRRYGDVESWLVDAHGWFRLGEAQRQALPEGRQLYAIEDRLAFLAKERPRRMRVLRRTPATSLDGVIGKLRAVAGGMEPDEFPGAYRLLKATIRDLRALRGRVGTS